MFLHVLAPKELLRSLMSCKSAYSADFLRQVKGKLLENSHQLQ